MNEMLEAGLPEKLILWFSEHARVLPWRADNEPYHVWLSEIMLQQTRIETVIPYYLRFLERLPTVQALAQCSEETLMKLWEGLGYYSRARNLAKAARQMMERHHGACPESYEEWLALSGVGEYTAGAVASICFHLPEPAVDGNVLRVMTRFCADGRPCEDAALRREIRERLKLNYVQMAPEKRGAFTQALMELGETVCLPNGLPRCGECPLAESCLAHSRNCETAYPVRMAKRKQRPEEYTVYTLECRGRIAVRRRPAVGLLGGLWELPHLDGKRTAQQALDDAAAWGIGAAEICSLRQKSHLFTHIRWEMVCVHLLCTKTPDCFVWVTAEQLAKETAFPTAFKKALPEEYLK